MPCDWPTKILFIYYFILFLYIFQPWFVSSKILIVTMEELATKNLVTLRHVTARSDSPTQHAEHVRIMDIPYEYSILKGVYCKKGLKYNRSRRPSASIHLDPWVQYTPIVNLYVAFPLLYEENITAKKV